jgi:type II secretory pathway pseudopilin PulG
MKRFRLSTLMLLIVIAALGVALVVQQRRAARREAELQARLNAAANTISTLERQNLLKQWQMLSSSRRRSKPGPDGERAVAKAAVQ